MQAILSDIEPGGGSMNEPYALPAGVEFVLILAGQLQVTVAGEEVTLEEGDALTFTADMDHTFQAPAGGHGRAGAVGALPRPARPRRGVGARWRMIAGREDRRDRGLEPGRRRTAPPQEDSGKAAIRRVSRDGRRGGPGRGRLYRGRRGGSRR